MMLSVFCFFCVALCLCGLGVYCVCALSANGRVMMYGVCVGALFVCAVCLRVLRVMYGAMVYGLSFVVVVCVCCCSYACGVCMIYCVLLYGLLFVLFCNCACGF